MGFAQMHFNHSILQNHQPGLTVGLFAEIFTKLPPDSKIYSIGEQYGQAMGFITIESNQFVDTPDGAILPHITPVFRRCQDGSAYLEQVDLSNVLKPAHEAPYGSIRDCEPELCQHEWAVYDSGFTTRYEYCRNCDCKKEN